MMLYLDRSEVRSILIGQPDECLHITESVLAEIDALPIFTKDDVAAALSAAPVETWKCAARKQSLPEPADCGWPTCGCDPHADKVIAALEEQGHAAPVAQEPVATAPVSPDVWTRRVVREAMQDAWNDICHDTGCHPIDIRNVNGVVFFEPRHWAEQVASLLFARTVRDTLASTPPATSAGLSGPDVARAIRSYCRQQSDASVQFSSDGIERIYYPGLSLPGLVNAILALLSRESGSDRK